MKTRLEKPSKDNLEEQLEQIFAPIYQSGQIVNPASPMRFMQLWYDGAIKVFTAKDGDTIKAVRIYMVMQDVLDKTITHKMKSISVGVSQELDDYAQAVLEAL